MSTLQESLKDLIAKVPNIQEEIRKVMETPERKVQDRAWVYNGFDTIEMTFLGRYTYTFPKGEVTEVGPIEHQEPDQSKSDGGHIVWTEMHLPGESIAREIIETRGWSKRGLQVILEPKVPLNIKAHCDTVGKREIEKAIENFKLGRDKAKAGVSGYKINPDPQVYRWMQELAPDDEMFAEKRSQSDATRTTAEALKTLAKVVDRWERPPRRKPLETDADYKERIAQEGWEKDDE